jgi:ABC-type branched-subunit amino acid transport system substrate-binding protein
MKRTIALLSMLVCPALLAQPQVTRPSSLNTLSFQLERLEAIQRERAAAIRRDAFIVSQLVVATASLDDFQRNAAMQKAREAIDAAQRRARENPPASIHTATALSKVYDLAKEAQKQGASADIPTLKRDILRQTHFVQQELFKGLQESRADRQAMTDLQARISRMATDLDQALGEALGATFDFFRAGGQ